MLNENIQHYAALIKDVNTMASRLNALAYNFKEEAAITTLDESLIDSLVLAATEALTEANALKDIAYDPTPEEDSGSLAAK